MSHLKRIIELYLPPNRSTFFWGPRQTGKSTLLRERFPDSLSFDLLRTDLAFDLLRDPALFRQRVLAASEDRLRLPIIVDEVQKVPGLLDEVHWLIENRGLSFILSGSSARSLRRGNVNLLGGRAWRAELFPLVSEELPDWDLLRMLNRGLLPAHYLTAGYRKSLLAYVRDYLREEVFAEGLVRSVPAFSRFFDALAYSHGELTNYSNIARDAGVDSKTVKEYFQILVDTLLGRFVEPYKRRTDRRALSRTPKFYLFDVGVAGALTKRKIEEPRGEQFGRALEHLVFMELVAHSSYSEQEYPVRYWRTKSGQEVDFVLGEGDVAVEVKGTDRLSTRDLRGTTSFVSEYRPKHALVVCMEAEERVHEGIRVVPVRRFLEKLWQGEWTSDL
ncbi:MAG: DUF4143 domain-containing protein [Candidatus Eisenbacteria bacterium]